MPSVKTVLLIVDHNDAFLEIAKAKLSKRNFEVLTANSCAKAINIVENFIVDSVLLNVHKTNEQKQFLDYLSSIKSKPVVMLLDEEIKVIQ